MLNDADGEVIAVDAGILQAHAVCYLMRYWTLSMMTVDDVCFTFTDDWNVEEMLLWVASAFRTMLGVFPHVIIGMASIDLQVVERAKFNNVILE